jgi:hypothetical protein
VNKIIILLIFFIIFSCKLYSQVGLGQFLETWKGTYEVSYEVKGGIAPGIAKEILSINGIHKDVYLQMHRTGWMAEDSAYFNWSTDEFLTVDLEKMKIVGVWIDDNGSGWFGKISGELEEGDKISYLIKSHEQTFTETWELKDNKLSWKTSSKDKETGKDNGTEAVYTKKK